MKTLEECKQEAAREIFNTEVKYVYAAYANQDDTRSILLDKVTDRAAEIYAEQFYWEIDHQEIINLANLNFPDDEWGRSVYLSGIKDCIELISSKIK